MDESVDFNDSMMDLDLLMKEEDPFALIKDMIPPGRFRFDAVVNWIELRNISQIFQKFVF